MTRPFEAANAETTVALRELAGSLRDEDLLVDLGEGWTVSMALAHLAFWDSLHAARWTHAAATGALAPMDPPGEVMDRNNEALVRTWRAVPGRAAVTLCLEAAAEMDAVAAGLTDEQVEAVRAAGAAHLAERHRHRLEHVDQISRALGR